MVHTSLRIFSGLR